MAADAPYRLQELGWLQFERLCGEVLAREAGVAVASWEGPLGGLRTTLVPAGLTVRGGGPALPGPTLAVVWTPQNRGRAASKTLLDELAAARDSKPASILVLTDVRDLPRGLARKLAGVELAVLGPAELGSILDGNAELRRRLPFVLGVRDPGLISDEVARRSTADVDACVRLARVFVPTRAYIRTLDVLDTHRFAVVTGPPEMGKTAIARTVALAAMADGWEAHECVRPDELWRVFDRDRAQVFVADDAFGSTEYRPEAAERWALELDRVLRAMDDRHRLIWTSRPAPLNGGLRRIHREHGVERFPAPAQVQVAAAELALDEKALMLFRHARAAELPPAAVGLVQASGWDVVAHAHFTPERIRRFVADRLPELASRREADDESLAAAVRAVIREPTAAMAASLRALGPEHRALLVALVDSPPGAVPERELAAAVRRHSDHGMPHAPWELVDRLADHFVRVVPPTSVTWVHPSWRDLLIEDLAADASARRSFLEHCSLEGLLLALSVGGGAAGERRLPLVLDDVDWDAVSDRLARLVPELDESELFRVLASVGEVLEAARGLVERGEAEALVRSVLDAVRRRWESAHAPIPVSLLELWLVPAARLADPPEPPPLAPTWIELLPTESIDLREPDELARLDDWIALARLLAEVAPRTLGSFGFPARQSDALAEVLAQATRLAASDAEPALREQLARALLRLARLVPDHARLARGVAHALLPLEEPGAAEPVAAAPASPRRPAASDRALVRRILRDLG